MLKRLLYIVKHCHVFIIECIIRKSMNEIVSLCYAQSHFPLNTLSHTGSVLTYTLSHRHPHPHSHRTYTPFKSRRVKNKHLTGQRSNSNTVWFNFQTHIESIIPDIYYLIINTLFTYLFTIGNFVLTVELLCLDQCCIIDNN